MNSNRRDFLQTALILGLGAGAPHLARAAAPRIAVVGGGWAGLAAATRLCALGAGQVTLVEPQARFFSLPLSTRVLAGAMPRDALLRDYAQAARRHGFVWRQARVRAIEREVRRLALDDGKLDYDYLVLATGVRHDYAQWFGEDRAAAELARSRYGAAYLDGAEFDDLQQRVAAFTGGDILLNLPPAPYRCPPAPYERAIALAHVIRQRGLKARVTVLDPGPGGLGFRQHFAERYADTITHVANCKISAVDPARRIVQSDQGEHRFDAALLMPPQSAGTLLHEAGLVETDPGAGNARGWGAVGELSLRTRDDERVFLAGDTVGKVSSLFGQYGKTGQIAARLGAIAAEELFARSNGKEYTPRFPDGVCHIATDFAPETALRVDSSYRLRGDGVITQEIKQHREAQPRGEAQAWLGAMLGEWF